jgi:aspartyl-tRNA(Asn)/glutamyl-tRNA(Gln) amidotransferase subunit A
MRQGESVDAMCKAVGLTVPNEELRELVALSDVYVAGLQQIREVNAAVEFDPFPMPSAPPIDAVERAAHGKIGDPPSWATRTAEDATRIAHELERFVESGHEPTNAFITWRPSERRSTSGPLNGAVFGAKDNIHVAGEVTTCGATFRVNGAPALDDSPLVRSLREAGALHIGKLNLGEFAVTFDSPQFGRVKNPWNPERIAGGSSGGSAAAVAAGYLDFALGTDSAGSVRMPAAMCGIVGFRPTNGSLTLRGIEGPAWTVDSYGVFARSVGDVAAVMDELTWACWPARPKSRPIRIGVVLDDSMGLMDESVSKVYRASIGNLADTNLELVPISLPGFELALYACAAIAYSEVGWQHYDAIRSSSSNYGPDSRPLIRLGQLFETADYMEAQRLRFTLFRRYIRLTSEFDAIMTPTVPITAPASVAEATVAGDDTPLALFTTIRYTALANFLCLPSISIPAGLSVDGLPVGIQIMGSAFKDRDLLAVAREVENRVAFRAKPQLWWSAS